MARSTDAFGPGALARQGFDEPERAARQLAELGPDAAELIAILARTADPSQALNGLHRLSERLPSDFIGELADDEGTAMRLLAVLGHSLALTDHLARHPEDWRTLADPTIGSTRPAAFAVRRDLLLAVGADPADPTPVATASDAVDALRVGYYRRLTILAARDLAHGLGLSDVAAELSDLAAAALEAALAVARATVGEPARTTRLAVIAMGKTGGHELNYVSDVDVVFVHEPVDGADPQDAARAANALASQLMQVCGAHSAEGTLWPVDAALRPEGKAGSLSRTLASHAAYYDRWAKTWEFQALLKARFVAGDAEVGRAYEELTQPLVWTAVERDGFVADVQAMRRRVIDNIPAADGDRQLKLGAGGLRDVEFAVQLLQLVHGRTDESVRAASTLAALDALTERGYVGREDGEQLHRAYEFLRSMEHRIQLHQLRRTHVVPRDEPSLRRLGRSLGFLKEPAASLDREWQHHRREVRRLHEKLFYRPLLAAVARIPGETARLSPEAAESRMAALGYLDPKAALRHLEALTTGVSRTAAIQRQLLPALLEWFGDAPYPDAGLFGFRRLSEALGSSHWFLKTLRDEGQVAERLATALGTSRYVSDLLEREPKGVALLGESLTPLGADSPGGEMAASAGRQEDPESAVRAIRGIRRRELLRIAAGELLGETEVEAVGAGLSRLTDATLQSTLDVVAAAVARERGLAEPPTRIAIVAMGRYGGFELSYASDADVLFVHEPESGASGQEATSYAQAVANELRRLLALPATDPPLQVDADLRPEGKQGPLVRTLDSYAAYYAKWSKVWEAQALLRADAVVGDEEVRRRFTALIAPLRYPEAGLAPEDVREIRRIKARVDNERLPRGADPKTHLKLGRGGLADVEWTVQLLQLQHAHAHEAMRTPRTLEALRAAVAADVIDADRADQLAEAWRLASRIRNAVTLVAGKGGDQMPRDPRERDAVARVLGYPANSSEELMNDYLRATRHANQVVDEMFWG